MNMFKNLLGIKDKPKREIPRHEVSEYGEPKYSVTHLFTLDEYREYNWVVSQPAIKQDKKLKMWGAIIMGVIAVVFLGMGIPRFDLQEYLAEGRSFWQWLSYTGFMFYFVVFLMAGYICFHLGTYYKFFPKRLEKATKDYYEKSKYLTNEITLAVYEDGVLEKASVRDEFFDWDMFQRCWESDNIVYIEFNLANQLFVAKHTLEENGIDKDEFMKFCNDHIEEAKRLAAEREEQEDAEEEKEQQEFEENQKKIEELEEEKEAGEDSDEETGGEKEED